MIWPFPVFTLYKFNKNLDDLFMAFLAEPDLVVVLDPRSMNDTIYYAEAVCSLGALRFWIVNEDFAFASCGYFRSAAGVRTDWDRQMPSRWAGRKMRRLVEAAKRELDFPKVI